MPSDAWYSDGLQFTCTQCGNCCTGPPGYVWLDDDEAAAIATRLGIDLRTFFAQYTRLIDGRVTLNETYNRSQRGYDCVFLDRDKDDKALCTIYEDRPAQCRTWPFWPENIKSQRAWREIAKTCPGVDAGIGDKRTEPAGRFYPVEQIRIIRDKTPPL